MASVAIHWNFNGDKTKGWPHTHGMDAHGLPELELRDIPGFLARDAGAILRQVCDYLMTSEKPVVLGRDHVPFTALNFSVCAGCSNPGPSESLRSGAPGQIVDV